MAHFRPLLLSACILLAACDKAPAPRSARAAQARHQSGGDSAARAGARAAVADRYAAHWRGSQGFSRETLRDRKGWFTPALYELMRADMSGEDLGVIDHDPFTSAQDVARRYVVGSPRVGHDTVYVPVDVQFESAGAPPQRVTLAMIRSGDAWQIGDFIDQYGSLANRLRTPADSARH